MARKLVVDETYSRMTEVEVSDEVYAKLTGDNQEERDAAQKEVLRLRDEVAKNNPESVEHEWCCTEVRDDNDEELFSIG